VVLPGALARGDEVNVSQRTRIVTVAASWATLAGHIEHPRYSPVLSYLTTCALGLLRGSTIADAARLDRKLH
jgi:hypothetical protein